MKKILLKSLVLLCALVVGTSSSWGATGTLVSALNGITSGDTYYIAALNSDKYYTVPNTTISGQTFTCTEGSISGNILTPASGAGEFVFTAVNEVENAFYIYNTSLKRYLVATGSKTFGYVESSSSDYGYWTFSTVGSGGFSGVFSVQHGTKTHYMRAYNNTVKCYDGTSNNGVYLFKKNPSNQVVTPSINGETKFLNSTEVSISCATDGASIQYSTNGGSTWTAYSAPFSISETTTVQAKATKSEMDASEVASKTFTKIIPMTVAEARDAIDAETGTTGVYVRGIVCEGGSSFTSGAMNYWISDDGTETDKFEVYKGKGLNGANFTSTDDIKVGDIVIVTGDIKKYGSTYEFNSGSQLFVHIPKVNTPTFSPAAGAVAANTEVTISTTTEGATIYYTVDGSDPTTSSSVYSIPIIIDAAKTVKAFAVKAGFPDSDIATAVYTIAEPCATPTFSLAAGEVEKGAKVTIACGTDGATIHYTTDGSTPTTSSATYSSAITINSAMTIKAIAIKNGYANSVVATAAYTVRDYAILPFSYDGGKSNLPSGLTESGLDSDYGSSPKLKFNDTGDYLILKFAQNPGQLSFTLKGNSIGGNYKFSVLESANGTDYSVLEEYDVIGGSAFSQTLNPASTTRYIKWIYTTKDIGNVALGKISLNLPVSEPSTPVDNGDNTVTLTTTANMAGWRTFAPIKANQNYTVDGTTKVYYASATAGGKVTLAEIAEGVPANTPVILHQTSGTTITLTETATNITAPGSNLLKVSTASQDLGTVYRLGYKSAYGVGFYTYTTNSAPADIVYLETVTAAHEFLGFDFDGETTAINNLTPSLSKGEGEYYDLQGRKVAQPTKGLYIVNGKKVVIK